MIHEDISLIEINENPTGFSRFESARTNDEITCYRCGRISDIEDSHCGNCGAPLREDLVLL